jgi:hypothetical protein
MLRDVSSGHHACQFLSIEDAKGVRQVLRRHGVDGDGGGSGRQETEKGM